MTVLQRKELESSPLADLHAIASELGLEGFRSKRKDDLIVAILAAQGGEGEADSPPAAGGRAADGARADGALGPPEPAAEPEPPAEVEPAVEAEEAAEAEQA